MNEQVRLATPQPVRKAAGEPHMGWVRRLAPADAIASTGGRSALSPNARQPGARVATGLTARTGTFAVTDLLLVLAVAVMWGSSFLFIRISAAAFQPPVVAFLRIGFGAAVLGLFPAARRRVPRADWPAIALLGLVWMALPFVLFAAAERQINSSLAGMINAAAPLFTALVAAVAARHPPGGRQTAGLLLGFAGVVILSWPALGHAHATALAVGLVLAATALYGVAFNLAPPLERRNGALAVVWWAQLAALAIIAPFGLASAGASSFTWASLLAAAALGIIGTALAFVAFTTLVGRVGSTRGSVTTYLLPLVAIGLGATIRGETITALPATGTIVVLAGAYLTATGHRRARRMSAR